MSAVCLYAVLGGEPSGPVGRGVLDEPLRIVSWGSVVAAIGDTGSPPPLDAATMRAHDQVVKRLAGLVDAIVPARFGSCTDETTLARTIEARAEQLRAALALVRGREQMTLRVYGAAAPADPPIDHEKTCGPGTRYLSRRLLAVQASEQVPEIAPVTCRLEPLVHATRIRRHGSGPLLATVHHLIGRDGSAPYLASLEDARPGLAGVHVLASGPWPPYAFAPGVGP